MRYSVGFGGSLNGRRAWRVYQWSRQGAAQAENDEMKRRGEVMREEAEILYALKEVLGHVAVFCATARQDFHETVVKQGLSFATTIMDEVVVQGQKAETLAMVQATGSFGRRPS
jgi:hypothetical protein